MPNKAEFLIETDILADHLTFNEKGKSILEKAMRKGICFTSVINASELYFAARNDNEKHAVDMLLRTINVLGIHARYCLNVGEFNEKVESMRDALICALVKNNNIGVLTNNNKKYKFAGIKLIDPKTL